MKCFYAATLSALLLAGCTNKPEPYETNKPVIDPKVMSSQGPTVRGGESMPHETDSTGTGTGMTTPENRPALDPAASGSADLDKNKSLASPTGGSLADPIRKPGQSADPSMVPLDRDPATPSKIINK